MQIPLWIKPALLGAGGGAIALAILGFGWGGWVTGATSRDVSAKESAAAIVAALTPYCLERAQSDPVSVQVLTELKAASVYNRRGIVEKAGWATPLGADKPNTALAQACQLALAEKT
jgi:hypothetical protein